MEEEIMGIKQTLASFMKEPAYRPMDIEELIAVFDIKKNEYNAFKKTLRTMENEGLIIRTKKDKYMIANANHEEEGLIIGSLQSHSKGFGFFNSRRRGTKRRIYTKQLYKWSYEW